MRGSVAELVTKVIISELENPARCLCPKMVTNFVSKFKKPPTGKKVWSL